MEGHDGGNRTKSPVEKLSWDELDVGGLLKSMRRVSCTYDSR